MKGTKKPPIRTDLPWTKRQEIPDLQVLDAANQYEQARRILAALAAQLPSLGVLLPLMNTAIMAVELYLKCLSTEVIHVKDEQMPDVSRVYARPAVTGMQGHGLVALLDVMPDDVRTALEAAFDYELTAALGIDLRGALMSLEGAFMTSRYPFEYGMDICRYNFGHLMALAEFLGRFAMSIPVKDRITW